MDKERFHKVALTLGDLEPFEMAEPPGKSAYYKVVYFREINPQTTVENPSIYIASGLDMGGKPIGYNLIVPEDVEDMRKIDKNRIR